MLNYANLVGQGRAKDIGIPWTPEENELLHLIVQERGMARVTVADYLRMGGIESLEDFDAVIKKGIIPQTREELEKEAKAKGVNFDEGTPDTVLAKHVGKAKEKKKPK